MQIDILTLFPKMFLGPFSESIIKRAVNRELVKINLVNIRDFGLGKHKQVDDKPYGGGVGMIMRPDVVVAAIKSLKTMKQSNNEAMKIVLLDPRGKTYNQKTAREFSKLDQLVLVCGHYEGVDERVKNFVDYSVSIGDYVLTGGEIPAMAVVDSIVRLLPGVLVKPEATKYESFAENVKIKMQKAKLQCKMQNVLEYPQYTRPELFQGLKVPEVLLSGDHKKIKEWQKKMTKIK